MRIRKGDKVRVLTGKDRGKEGEVITAMPRQGKVVVEGVNVAKRHQRPTRSMQQGGIIEKPMPLDVSNVALVEGGNATRVGMQVAGDGTKRRVSKRTGSEL